MITAYLKAKTFDELIIKQLIMNTLAGREFQYTNSFYAKNEFYVTFKCDYARWRRLAPMIDERIKLEKEKQNKADK